MRIEEITFRLAGYGAGGTKGAVYELVITDATRSQRYPVESGGSITFERAFGTTTFRIDTTFADGVIREGEEVIPVDLPEESDTPAEGAPFDRGEIVSLKIILDDGTAIEASAE